MKISVFVLTLVAALAAQASTQATLSTEAQECSASPDILPEYQDFYYEFNAKIYKSVGLHKEILGHFVFSPLSTWLTLATIAEGAEPATRDSIFKALNLPNDPCTRQKFYQIAVSRFTSNYDADISNKRILVIDERVQMNPLYHNFVFKNSLLDVVSAPIRRDPRTALEEMRRVASASLQDLNLSGNSVILDTFDYNGLWSTAFEDAVSEKAPFYNEHGAKIGSVDLMTVTMRVRATYFKKLGIKAIELPVANNDRYRLIIGLFLKSSAARAIAPFDSETVQEFMNGFKETLIPIKIALPRTVINSEYDMRKIVENLGIRNIWTDPNATRNISNPAVLPSAFAQRTTVSFNKAGLKPPRSGRQYSYNAWTGIGPEFGQDFIANKPFGFGFVDSETYTFIMTGAFTEPTYTD